MELKGFYQFDSYRADIEQQVLIKDGEIVPLSPKPFAILVTLLEGHGKVVLNATIKERVWPETHVDEGSIPFAVHQLRTALGDNADSPRYIKTIRGRGYVFMAEVVKGSPNEAIVQEQPTPSNLSSDNVQDIQVRWWSRYRKVIILTASIIIFVVAGTLSLRDQPSKVFPQFGAGIISDNPVNISEMKRELKSCQRNCLEGVEESLEVVAILEERGFAVVDFGKLFGFGIALKRQLVFKVRVSTRNPKFEIGLRDARQTAVFFDCQAPTSDQEYVYFVNLDAESLTKNGSKFQPQYTRSFSIGFAADAGSTPGYHRMEVFGIVSSDSLPVTSEMRPCEQRGS